MSKRSYRRLAVVAGAALAVGSMAPAMAVRISTEDGAAASVSADTVDVDSITSLLDLNGSEGGLGLGLGAVAGVAGSVVTTVGGLPHFVVPTALGLADDALCIPTGLVGTALDAEVGVLAGLHVGLGGIAGGAGALGLVNVPVAAVGTVADCAFDLVGDTLHTVGAVKAAATPVVSAGVGVAAGVVATATGVPGLVLGLPGHVMGLGDLLSVNASGNASLGAALVGIL